MRAPHLLLLVAGLLVALSTGRAVSPDHLQTPAVAEPSSALIDAVVTDAWGRQVTSLTASDLRVSIDGEPRSILSVRYVWRGPGAETAARPVGAASGTVTFTDPTRTVLLVADENSISRGAEHYVVAEAWRVIDRLAPADRVALLALPVPRGRAVLSTSREPLRAAVANVIGRAAPGPLAGADARTPVEPDIPVSDEQPPERNRPAAMEQKAGAPAPQPGLAQEAGGAAADQPGIPAQTSWQALARVLRDLRAIPGPKAIVYFWGGSWGADPADPMRARDPRVDLPLVVEAAAASRTVVHAIDAAQGRRHDSAAPLVQLARDTGGTYAKAGSAGADLTELSTALSGGLLIEVESRPGDRDGRAHTLDLGVTREGFTARAARRWMPRNDPPPAPSAMAPATAPVPARASKPAGRSNPEVVAVLDRVSAYIDGYLHDFTNVVAEEDYVQRVLRQFQNTETVHLRSDFLLVWAPTSESWIPFRDVFEVNGKAVRDREDRLRKLFLEKPDTAMAEGLRITKEGARYNIGSVMRTINVPTLPLVFLMPAHVTRFQFEWRGATTMEGLSVWQLDYAEVGHPTVVRQADSGADLPSSGSIWVDPLTGRVVKTLVTVGDQSFFTETTVTYRWSETLGLRVPAEMGDICRLRNGSEATFGTATYQNFRRFQVSTQETVKVPK